MRWFSWLLVLAVLPVWLASCATLHAPLNAEDIDKAVAVGIQPDEAFVLARINVVSTVDMRNAVLTFRNRGTERTGMSLDGVLNASGFALRMGSLDKPILLRVKAGRIAMTTVSVSSLTAQIKPQLTSYLKPGSITYIGDVMLRVEGTALSWGVSRSTASLTSLRAAYPHLVSRYPLEVSVLERDR